MPKSGSYYYPQLTNNITVGSFDEVRLKEVGVSASLPDAIPDTSALFLSGTDNQQRVYYIDETGTIREVGYSLTSLSGALGEIAVTGALEFAKDAEPNAGHLIATNSDLILTASTGNVRISGNLNLNIGENLVFNADNDSDVYMHCPADNLLYFWVGAINSVRLGNTYLQLNDNRDTRWGTSADYWMRYSSTGTALELWSTSVDGGGTDGVVWWIEDGTDDVRFSGSLYLTDDEKIFFDDDADSWIGSLTDDSIQVRTGNQARLSISTNVQPASGTPLSMVDDNKINFGTGDDYWTIYNSTALPNSGAFELWTSNVDDEGTDQKVLWVEDGTDDVKFSGSLYLNNDQKLVFDTDEDGDTYIDSTATDLLRFYAGGVRSLQLQANSVVLIPDDIRLCLGTGADTLIEYDSVEGRFKLDVTDADGIGTNGTALWIDDGSDDLRFSGSLYLNSNEKLIFDADVDENNYILGNDTTLQFWVEGARPFYASSTGVVYADAMRIYFGAGSDYWQTYNSTALPNSGAFELWTSNVDDEGTDQKVLWIEDGTDDVRFSGSVVFGEEAVADTGHITTVASDLILSASTGNVYVSGALGLINNDGTYGEINVVGGKLKLAGVGGSNNENLYIDMETVANSIRLGSTSGANSINTQANGLGFVTSYLSVTNSNYITFASRGTMWSRANDQIQISNSARTKEVTLSAETDDTLTIKNGAGTGAGNLIVSGNLEVVGQIYGKNFTLEPTGSNPSIDIDWNSGSFQTLILASASLAVSCSFSNAQPGASYALAIVQNDVAIDVNWPTVKWENGTTPTVTATAAAEDVFTFVVRSASEIYGTQGSNFS